MWSRQESEGRGRGAVRGWNIDEYMSKAAYMRGEDTHGERNAIGVIWCRALIAGRCARGRVVLCDGDMQLDGGKWRV